MTGKGRERTKKDVRLTPVTSAACGELADLLGISKNSVHNVGIHMMYAQFWPALATQGSVSLEAVQKELNAIFEAAKEVAKKRPISRGGNSL
jgi:hypothetical protein